MKIRDLIRESSETAPSAKETDAETRNTQDSDMDDDTSMVDTDTIPDDGSDIDNDEMDKPVKPEVLNSLKNSPYITKYNHFDSDSKYDPARIMKMDMTGLKDLKDEITSKIQSMEMDTGVGLYANQDYKFYVDLLAFIKSTMRTKHQTV